MAIKVRVVGRHGVHLSMDPTGRRTLCRPNRVRNLRQVSDKMDVDCYSCITAARKVTDDVDH